MLELKRLTLFKFFILFTDFTYYIFLPKLTFGGDPRQHYKLKKKRGMSSAWNFPGC